MYRYLEAEAVGQNISIVVPQESEGDFHDIMERIKKGERIARNETSRRKERRSNRAGVLELFAADRRRRTISWALRSSPTTSPLASVPSRS